MLSEKRAYEWLKRHVFLPKDRIDRIENLVVQGMPDVNYCIDGIEGWIEIKAPTMPKRESTALFGSNHKVSQAQKNWFLRQSKAFGIGWIFIVTGNYKILVSAEYDNLKRIDSATTEEIIALSDWFSKGGTSSENRFDLREVLSGAYFLLPKIK